eukprot:1436217-Amphidinium_carterae.1
MSAGTLNILWYYRSASYASTTYMDPHQPNRYVRCGATTSVGGDIICLKCARTNAWIRTEGWRVLTDEELGDVWTNLPQQENEVIPGMGMSMHEILDSDDTILAGRTRLLTSMIGRQCWHPGCLLQGFQLCERRNCNEYACGAHNIEDRTSPTSICHFEGCHVVNVAVTATSLDACSRAVIIIGVETIVCVWMEMATLKAFKLFDVRVTRRLFHRTVIMLLAQEVLTKVNAMFVQIQEECYVNMKDSLSYTDVVENSSVGSMPKSFEITMTWSRECGVPVIQEKDPERMSYQPRGVDIVIPRGISSSANGRYVDNMLVMIVMLFDTDHQHMFLLCLRHYASIDVEYSRIRTHLSELITVSE